MLYLIRSALAVASRLAHHRWDSSYGARPEPVGRRPWCPVVSGGWLLSRSGVGVAAATFPGCMAIPEPSSLDLQAHGAVGLLARRRSAEAAKSVVRGDHGLEETGLPWTTSASVAPGRRGGWGASSPEPEWGYAGPRMARMRLIRTDPDGIVDSPKRGGWCFSSIRDYHRFP